MRALLQNQQQVLGKYLAITTWSNNTINLSGNHLIYTRECVNDKFIPGYVLHSQNLNIYLDLFLIDQLPFTLFVYIVTL